MRIASISLVASLTLTGCTHDTAQPVIIPQHSHEAASIRTFGSFYSDEMRRTMRKHVQYIHAHTKAQKRK